MKIAVLADIHANYRALEAVGNHVDLWEPDRVFVAGDIVNRGPRSSCCLKWVEERRLNNGWNVIRGNHEDYVIERESPGDPKSGPLYEMYQPVHFTYHQLNQDVSPLRALPEQLSLDLDNIGEVRLHHASMLGNRDGIYPENSNTEIIGKISPPPAVFVTGHTHRSLVRSVNSTLVVNAGSVGLPFDGDTRAAYAQITHQCGRWQAKVIRIPYDLKLAELDFHEFGFLCGGGPLVDLILLELQTGFGQLYHWVTKYNHNIKKGEITVEESVKDFLKNPVTKPYW